VWTFDPRTRELLHRANLYFRRPDSPGVYGDHATHLVRDGDDWLMLTFDGTTYGGAVLGYGTHGDVIVMRSGPSDRATEPAGGAE
jgi:hypothetical protein